MVDCIYVREDKAQPNVICCIKRNKKIGSYELLPCYIANETKKHCIFIKKRSKYNG